MELQIWIEAEHLAEDVNDFCNIAVYLSTGERFAMNVWTFDFFALARAEGEMSASAEAKHLYMRPPDLFVKDLTRPTIEAAVVDMLQHGDLPAHCLAPEEAFASEDN